MIQRVPRTFPSGRRPSRCARCTLGRWRVGAVEGSVRRAGRQNAMAKKKAAKKKSDGAEKQVAAKKEKGAKKQAEQADTVAASIGAPDVVDTGAATTLADVFAGVPAKVDASVHDPKPAAKKSAPKRQRLSELASHSSHGGSATSVTDSDSDESSDAEDASKNEEADAADEDLNPGWKARMLAEKSAGITKVRGESTPAEVIAERKRTGEARTIFIGNLPLTHAKNKPLRKLFKSCGAIESVRFRSFTVSDLRMPKKAAFINSSFHEQRDSCNAYVVFKSMDESVMEAALAKNNMVVDGHHIRVDRATRSSDAKDGANKRSVFVGNLPFDVTEESLRAHFEDAGMQGIENVRIVRDPKTGLGKGIAFVGFSTEDATVAALALHESEFGAVAGDKSQKKKGRQLRIFRASAKLAAQAHKRGHSSDGHTGTVGNPMRQSGDGRGRGAGRGRGRGGRGARGGRARGGMEHTGGSSGAPAWQGQRSEAGYIPAEVGSKRKKGGGGHSVQNKKPKRRHIIRM